MTRVAWGLLVVWLLSTGHAAAGPYDPALRFLTLKTAHFQIHYHRGEEAMAERLSRIAEATHTRLSTAWALGGDRRTHVVLVDQTDVSNGAATVVPWNAIVIYPVPPTGAETIGDTDDWLEYVFVHEYAHILHLDQSRGWARLARGLFGRTVIGFPNLTLPLWQIEGLATLVESEGGLGRLHGGDFREVVDAAGRAGRIEPLDRVNGGLVDWPAGQGWYAYGARFHEFLARTYGAQRLGELVAATAGKPPFMTSGAFSEVYGKSLGQLWKEFEATVVRDGAPMPASSPRPLTSLGYLVDAPREGADGAIYFTATDADRFPGIYRLPRGATAAEHVVSRYGGTGISVSDREMLFDQLELVRGSALMSDLYLRDLRTGRTRRLTREARLSMADYSPDGTRIAAVQAVAGARDLVVLDAVSLTASPAARTMSLPVLARAGEGEAVFANPRWSPDGRTLAAERRQRNGPSTIVLLDGETLDEHSALVGGDGDRLVNPAWSSDGATLYYAQAVGESPFQLRAVDIGPGGRISVPRPLPEVAGGARAPLPLRDGRMVFVGYRTAGNDLFELPDAVSRMTAPSPAASLQQPAAGPAGPAGAARPVGPAEPAPYRPWPTLAPRGWLPDVEHRDGRWRAGASAVGVDVLNRHVVSGAATWALTSGDVSSDQAPRTRPDWSASYTYQRWQPSFYIAAQDRTSLFQAVIEPGALVPVAQREQTVDVGAWFPVRRIRWVQTMLAAYHVERLTTDLPLTSDRRTRAGLRGAWIFSSARRYGHSISQEDGVTLAATGEAFAPGLGSDGRSDAVSGDGRAYLPMGIPHAIAAVRAAFAASRGDARVQRRFRLGGSGGDPVAGSFGSDAISLLRGFPDEVFVGERVALVNLELRMPIWSVQRGWGTWPLFLRTLHAAAFADVGNAWTGPTRWADRKIGYGAEISADVVAGFGLPLTWTAGIGWGDDGAGVVTGAREVYFRVGRSF